MRYEFGKPMEIVLAERRRERDRIEEEEFHKRLKEYYDEIDRELELELRELNIFIMKHSKL